MSQGDCVRVQTAQLRIQKAARKGILPLDLERLIAILRATDSTLPIGLNQAERLLIAAHLETCDTCRSFWQEQLKLSDLLGDAGFDLPPEATQLETARLQRRVLELTSAAFESTKPRVTARFEDYLTEKREVRVSSQFKTKRMVLVAAGVLIVVLGVVYFSFLYPPVDREDVQGAIGRRDVYRDTNVTEKDVAATSGPGGPSYAGLVEFLKSPEFKALTSNSNYQGLVSNQTAFSQLATNSSFQALCNQIVGTQGSGLVNSFIVLISSGLAQNSAFHQLFQSQQFQQAVGAASNYNELVNSLASSSAFQSLAQNSQFHQLMNNSSFYSFVHQNASALIDLSSMVNNSAFQQLAQNANGMQSVLQNSAFNSLLNNQSFQFLSVVSNLQSNSAFQGLIVDSNFIGLVNSSEFQQLAGNQLFQQLLQDSNFQQIILSQEQGSLANNSQFSQLINSAQYQSLATNSQFQSLLNNGYFTALLNNSQFQNLMNNSQFASFLGNSLLTNYASSANGMQNMLQQSHLLGTNLSQQLVF
ncbi:MAG: anti-sigma factor [Acidobacteriota bacterium]